MFSLNKENLFSLLCWNDTLKCKEFWQRLEGYTLCNQGIWRELVTSLKYFQMFKKILTLETSVHFFNHADQHGCLLVITQYSLSFSFNI